jgi:hypothetical protein
MGTEGSHGVRCQFSCQIRYRGAVLLVRYGACEQRTLSAALLHRIMAKPKLPALPPPRPSFEPFSSILPQYVRERTRASYYPNKSICAGWGDSMFKTGAAGVGAVLVGSAGLEWRSRNSLSFLKSSFSVGSKLP